MSLMIYPALVFTVALLVTTAYFLLGGLPLLVLDHDTALDARFVRGFFDLYYRCAFVASVGTSLSFLGLGRIGFALGAAGLAATAWVLRRQLTEAMDRWAGHIQAHTPWAVQRFRRVHGLALMINVVQLVLIVWALLHLSLDTRP